MITNRHPVILSFEALTEAGARLICAFTGIRLELAVFSLVSASIFPHSAEIWLQRLASCLSPSWINHQPPHTQAWAAMSCMTHVALKNVTFYSAPSTRDGSERLEDVDPGGHLEVLPFTPVGLI